MIRAMRSARSALALILVTAAVIPVDACFAQDQPRFSVMGIVIKEEGKGVAWVGEPTYTKDIYRVVREGQEIGPYRVTKISEDRVELTGPAGVVVARLGASAPETGTPPATASPAQSQATAEPKPMPEELAKAREAARAHSEALKAQVPPKRGFGAMLGR